jgi:steroid delta-isomerase-like uncharacterized protein
MSTEENKAIDRRLTEEGWNQGNTAVFDELIAADFIGHNPDWPIHGLEGYKQFYAATRSAFPDMRFSIEDQIAEGDRVVLRLTGTGTHQGELRGIPPSGKRITMTGMVIFRSAGGRVAEGWYNYDTLGLLQQIGAIPAPGQAS